MKVVFISNYYNHHQSAFSESMNRLTNGNYYFIATEPMEEERRNMGWEMQSFPDFVKLEYTNEESHKLCQTIIDTADVVIIGCASDKFIQTRLKNGGLTFRYWERPYKQDVEWYRLLSHIVKTWFRSGRYKNLYMLCASAYTSSDCKKIFSFYDKCYKWGYFPKLKNYSNIENLVSTKRKNSLLWVARLIELKHPEAPIEVVRRLKNEGYDVHLSLIGVGPLQKQIESLIDKYGLQNEINLLGKMSPDDVRNYMDQSEIFMFTSDKNEGWGAVLNESMNSGCAVVSSHLIGSTPFLIKDGVNGLIYKGGDINDLYTKVKYLLDNPVERKRISLEAYQTMVNVWNAETASQRLLGLISSLQSGTDTPYVDGPCSKAEILYDNWKK